MKKFYINGRAFTQRLTGVQRMVRESTRELDKICSSGEIFIVLPQWADIDETQLGYKNIELIRYGNLKGNLWDQISLYNFARKQKGTIVNLTNIVTIAKPGISAIHDLTYVKYKQFHTTLYGKIAAEFHTLQFSAAIKHGDKILTVSQFSKNEIIDYYHYEPSKIYLIGNGYEHILRCTPDYDIIKRFNLDEVHFIFTLGSIEKNKNVKWIYEVAKNNPEYMFVIGGGSARNHAEALNPDHIKNILFTGYLSDNEIVALYKKCKAFALPSTYEGFGIPPLEALALGCDVMCSNAACMPEIYKNSVHWFNPIKYDYRIDEILSSKTYGKEEVLNCYTWENTAKRIYEALYD